MSIEQGKILYVVKRLTTAEDWEVQGIPLGITFGEGMVGLLPVYETPEAAEKAWPGAQVLPIEVLR